MEVFEESASERGMGHFLDGKEGFSRKDIKGRLRKKEKEESKRREEVWEEIQIRNGRGEVLRKTERENGERRKKERKEEF